LIGGGDTLVLGVGLGDEIILYIFGIYQKGLHLWRRNFKNRCMEKKRRLSIEVGPGVGIYIAWDADEKELYVALPLLVFCFWLGKRKGLDHE